MTVPEFQDKYCKLCGTQSCLGQPEDFSHCGYYNGEIEGIPKIKTAMDLIEVLMKEVGITWEDLAREIEGELKDDLGTGINTDS